MLASANAHRLIKFYEKLKLVAYRCPAGIPTLGWGSTRGVQMGMIWTQDQAENAFRRDLATVEEFLLRHVHVSLLQQEFDALASWVFNIGGAKCAESTLLKLLNMGEKNDSADQLLRWNKGTVKGEKKVLPGLTKRRWTERHLFLHGELILG